MSNLIAIKSIKQSYQPTPEILRTMGTFRRMVNDCIRIGLANNASTLKTLTKFAYSQLAGYDILSYYKLHAISKAAGILTNRKQSIKRGYPTKTPYLTKITLVSCYGFKIVDGVLKVPLGDRRYFDILLNNYVRKILSDPSLKLRSFILTADNEVSICYSKEVVEIESTGVEGIDRNLQNLTVGDKERVVQYDLSKTVAIAENTRSILSSFKRNDARIRKRIYGKYGKRRRNRVNQLLHQVSKAVVQNAKESKSAIVFEDIRYIRRLYHRRNYQSSNYRAKLNSWSFAVIKRQIEYKAACEGVSIIELSSAQTRGTSQLCPRCGKRVQDAHYIDVIHRRQLWCPECKRWIDRDVVAAMNIAKKGGEVFHRSKGLAGEAMVQESGSKEQVILKVDASKLSRIKST